ncbi:MAG: RNA 2',3'-cyclic phosphodiesterase [Actinobacteria bacterium]|nr:RNA 2',3'-cyclic phosphodiesterase [Actinomycetota bacterium]
MGKERLKSPRARLFVALELPREAHTSLHEWQHDLDGRCPGDLRLVPDTALHVTLAFLGYRAERDIPAIAEVLKRSVPEGTELALRFLELLQVKPAGRPKLYAAALDESPELIGLRATLAAALSDADLFEDERRTFWPHVTLARVKRAAAHHRAPNPAPGAPASLTTHPHRATAVTLFRSHLEPSGARYEPLERIAL